MDAPSLTFQSFCNYSFVIFICLGFCLPLFALRNCNFDWTLFRSPRFGAAARTVFAVRIFLCSFVEITRDSKFMNHSIQTNRIQIITFLVFFRQVFKLFEVIFRFCTHFHRSIVNNNKRIELQFWYLFKTGIARFDGICEILPGNLIDFISISFNSPIFFLFISIGR